MAKLKKVATSDGRAPIRISATRAIKNARYLQKVAPKIMPRAEPHEGFGSVIPLKILTQLHRQDARAIHGLDPHIANQLKDVVFPSLVNASGDPLFNGMLYFARIQFTVQSRKNAVSSVSAPDVTTAIQYATQAATPISAYAGQYGPNHIAVHQAGLSFSVTLPDATYNDTQLQSWVDAIASANGLPMNSCVVVLNPQDMTNTSGNRAAGIGGYHGNASVPYIFVNLFGENLTVADEAFAYAQILSHEMAEMVVDPLVDGKNPEVCDGCGPNCQSVYMDFFGDAGYLNSTQSWPPNFPYRFYINAIVKPASATACPAPGSACDYAPPSFRHLPIEQVAHVRDAAWLIQLWLMIHGGDPAPGAMRLDLGEVNLLSTVRAIAGLSRCLDDAQAERDIIAAMKPLVARAGGRLLHELSAHEISPSVHLKKAQPQTKRGPKRDQAGLR